MSAPLALVLTGPTGSGKSDWAWRLAQELPVEIISVDSAQVYRGMDIGTAKPNELIPGYFYFLLQNGLSQPVNKLQAVFTGRLVIE